MKKTFVLRFMSAHEAIKLLTLQTLHNSTDHRQAGNKSESVGFCFVQINALEASEIYDHATYLSGVVSMDVCLIAQLKDAIQFKPGKAYFSVGERTELATEFYALTCFEDFKLYTPQHMSSIHLLAPTSRNWEKPVLTMSMGRSE